MPRLDGIDVSHWNAIQDFAAVRNSCQGSYFAMKCTEGVNFVDPEYSHYSAGAEGQNFKYILDYHWLDSKTNAQEQANFFLSKCSHDHGAMLDAEEDGITAQQVMVWCDAVEQVL